MHISHCLQPIFWLILNVSINRTLGKLQCLAVAFSLTIITQLHCIKILLHVHDSPEKQAEL